MNTDPCTYTYTHCASLNAFPQAFNDDDYEEIKLAGLSGLHNATFWTQYAKQDVILAKHITPYNVML